MTTATNTILGDIQLTGDLAGNGGTQVGTNPQLTYISGLTPGAYVVPNITVDSKGRITSISNSSSTDIINQIQDASTTQKGKVKIGANLYVNGTPSAGYQIAGFGGTLQPSTATGLCTTDTYTFTVTVDGALRNFSAIGSSLVTVTNVINAINSQFGSYLTATLTFGDIKLTSATTGATSNVSLSLYCGKDHLFSNMNGFVSNQTPVAGVSACEIYAKVASATDLGVCSITSGGGLLVGNGALSADFATITSNIPNASTSVYGKVEIGNGISVVGGVISADMTYIQNNFRLATTGQTGLVQIGNGISVNGSGLISADMTYINSHIPIATNTVQGIASVNTSNSGLSITNGAISGVLANSTTTYGMVASNNTNNITVNSGLVDVGTNIARLGTTNTFTIAQIPAVSNVSYTSSWTPNFNLANMFVMGDLTGNVTINNPTNITAGQTVLIVLRQDGTGGRTITWGNYFKFENGTSTVASLTSTSYTLISIICLSSTQLMTTISRGFI